MLELRRIAYHQEDFHLTADTRISAGFTALIGPSGAGKSTLLNMIAGFLAPTSGQVLWDGQEISGLPPAKRPVSILFQDNNLFPHLTVRANLALAMTTRCPDADQLARIEAALAQVGLGGMGGRRPAALSGGQQGRAALARVLLQDRPLMLLDEPFSALGPALRSEMLDLVARLAAEQGIRVLMVSHAPEDARRVADEVALVSQGALHPPQPTQGFFATPSKQLQAYLGDG
ncbi:ATP-binding cassette domain-containing protein [Marinovum algicola]|uniref:thiamine ABC transporter ATP-binding protein n=1 Tax=Marinovum algicola TaxID=42444 RepID=UPI0024BB418A|nr:ATP-binding cassette domain-containing protein [Marinovum algicola]